VEQGHAIATAINLARDYSNIPPNILTPAYYADLIQQHFSETEVIVDVKDSVTLQSEGCGLIHAVGKASKQGPRIITLTYNEERLGHSTDRLLVKDITYHPGRYYIKSKPRMQTITLDMSGSSNVIRMIQAARQLALPINIVGVIADAENMKYEQ